MLPSCLVFSDKREKKQLAPQVATVKTEYVSPSPADHEDEADDVEPAPAGAGAAGGGGGKPVSAELIMKQVRICRCCCVCGWFVVAGCRGLCWVSLASGCGGAAIMLQEVSLSAVVRTPRSIVSGRHTPPLTCRDEDRHVIPATPHPPPPFPPTLWLGLT